MASDGVFIITYAKLSQTQITNIKGEYKKAH